MKKYEETDEELVLRYRDGDADACEFLLNKYKNLVRGKAASMHLLGADNDDLIQEGMIGLFKAVRDYDSGRDASFFTFAQLCVTRQIYSAVEAAGRKKHIPLNTAISLYAEDNGDEEGSNMILEKAIASGKMSPEQIYIDQESARDLERLIDEELTDLERQVLELYMTGLRGSDIAAVLGRDTKSTDNALQRVRGKLRKYFDTKG